MAHPVDRAPSAPTLAVLSIQHVLAFYAGAVIVPLLIAGGLHLNAETTIHLINADLLTCGVATLIQSVGITRFVGVRLPIIQGVTTTAVAPIIAIGVASARGGDPNSALPTIYGAVIASGLFTFFAAPYFAALVRFFPPVVTGTVLLVMGTTLLSVSASDFVGYATAAPSASSAHGAVPLQPRSLLYAFGTLAAIVLAQRFLRGFLATIAVLIGLVGGTAVAAVLGHLDPKDIDAFKSAGSFAATTPFYFGTPTFAAGAIVSMTIVMAVTMVETTGDVFATGEIVGKRIRKADISAAIRADGLSTLLGGVMNSFPYTCFAQNVGLVRITRVKSRWVAAGAGVVMMILGVLPKAGALVATIPSPVLGGASLAMFANVAWVGMQTIAKADMRDNRNAVIVTTSLGLAMLVTFKPFIAESMPSWARIFFASGMTAGAIAAIALNVLFFHVGRGGGAPVVSAPDGRALTIDEVNAMGRERFVEAFSPLFNTQTWPLERAWESRPFADAEEFRDALEKAILTASQERKLALLRDYPDISRLLEEDDAAAQKVSRDIGSTALGEASPEELERLSTLAEAYAERFGWPLVAYLGPLDTAERLIESGARRLSHSAEQEQVLALSEVIDVAYDRFDMLLADANPVRTAWESKLTGQ